MGLMKRLLLVYQGLLINQLVHAAYTPFLKRFAQGDNVKPWVFCFYQSCGRTLGIFSFAYIAHGLCSLPSLGYGILHLTLHICISSVTIVIFSTNAYLGPREICRMERIC